MTGFRSRRRAFRLVGCGLLSIVIAGAAVYWIEDGSEQARGLRARMRHRHVILVSVDTLNVWYTSLFAEGGAPTPALEEIAKDGVWFEHAYTSVPITLPSHTALLTGRPPWSTGVLNNGDPVPDEAETLAEILSKHGYRTAAFLSLGVLNRSFALDQGFVHYDPVSARELGRWYRTADEVLEPAARWIQDHRRDSFFVWVHFSDPHGPYLAIDEPPDTELLLDDVVVGRWTLGRRERIVATVDLPPGRHTLVWRALPGAGGEPRPTPVLEVLGTVELERWAVESPGKPPFERKLQPEWEIELLNPGSEPVAIEVPFRGNWADLRAAWVRPRYRAEVTHADRHLGELRRLVERLGIGDEVLWVVVSDHGEGLFHHGALGHAANNREEQLRTLLLFDGPGLPERRRLGRTPVLLQDVYPTLLDLLGLPIPGPTEGRSLVECWGDRGCGEGGREWIAYGLDEDRQLKSFSVYRWPRKALWSRLTRPGVFDLQRYPREGRREHGLSQDPGVLPGFAAAIDDPASSVLVARLHRHISAFETLLAGEGLGELTDDQREMLEGLGYL